MDFRGAIAQNRAGIIVILTVAAVSFLAGFGPQYQRYSNAMGDLRLANKQLDDMRARERFYRLENMVLQALDRAAHKEYQEAQKLVGDFFLEVRADMARPDMRKFTSDFKQILDKNEAINVALERREDQSARDLLRGVMQQLAQIAGPPPTASDPPPIITITPTPQS